MKRFFLDQEELNKVKQIRLAGDLDRAEKILLQAEQTPATCDELRKIASIRAHEAKKQGDWMKVINVLEAYNQHAARWKLHCLHIVNQEPPEHTKTDQRLLHEAKTTLNNNR